MSGSRHRSVDHEAVEGAALQQSKANLRSSGEGMSGSRHREASSMCFFQFPFSRRAGQLYGLGAQRLLWWRGVHPLLAL